jgi:hypothetical protein
VVNDYRNKNIYYLGETTTKLNTNVEQGRLGEESSNETVVQTIHHQINSIDR